MFSVKRGGGKLEIVHWEFNRLEEIVQFWNKHLKTDFPLSHRLFSQNSVTDENVCKDSSFLALDEDDTIIGIVIAKRWQQTFDVTIDETIGYIQVLFVDLTYRNQGIGTKLLHHAESSLKRKGITKILLGSDPHHYFPGIPSGDRTTISFFEREGYGHQGTMYDLIHEYEQDDTLSASIPEIVDVTFSLLQSHEQEDFVRFLHDSFPGRWEYEAIHYFKYGGTGREFVVLKKAGRIIGFCRINDAKSPFIAQNVYWSLLFNNELGGVGPLGIDDKERGHGYGLAIVEAGIAFLRRRGVKRIVIDWTELVTFYEKLGYHIWKSYELYEKEL